MRGDPLGDSAWDRDLASCPGATFFHGSAWARVLNETYGFDPIYLLQREGNSPVSLLALMDVKSWLTGRRGVSLPFTDELAPLSPGPENLAALRTAAQEVAAVRRWNHIEYRGGKNLMAGAKASVSFVGHRLDLVPGPDALFESFEGSTRRAIRKADQSRLSVEFATGLGAMHAFHDLLCKTRRRHGVPPQPLAFFEQIHRHVIARDQGCVVLVRSGRTPIAGGVFFHFGPTVTYKFGASDERFQELRANNLVMWSAIEHFAGRGFATLDFGRTSRANTGLRKFKSGWGTTEHPIDYVRQEQPSGRYVATKDGAAGWHTRAMTYLPNPLFKLVGSLLYKHMA